MAIGLQVLVVRQDLKMGAGKIASQCARKFITKWKYDVS
jgi:peptidyl-tRNA hydrolase